MHPVRTRLSGHACELSVLALLALTTLWKGGKTLESTWALVAVATGCWTLVAPHANRQKYPSVNNMIWFLVMLFILWTGLSYLFSSTQNYGLDELLRTGGLGLLFLWYMGGGEEQKTGNQNRKTFEGRFFTALTWITVIICTVGLLVYIAEPVNRFVGTFFDWRFHTDYWPNAAAQFLLLAWPVVLLHSQSLKPRIPKLPYCLTLQEHLLRLLPVGLVLGSLFLTFSRGALVAFVGQIVLLVLLLMRQRSTVMSLRAPLRSLAAALLLGFLLFAAANELRSSIHPVQSVTEKLTFTAPEGSSSVSERVSFWKQAIVLAARRPVFGWGPYSFRFVQPRLQDRALATSDHPHNVFLKLGMESGVIAALLFAALLFLALYSGTALSLTGKRFLVDDHARLGYALLVTGIAGVVAHNLIDYNLQFVGISLPLWLTMGILMRHKLPGDSERSVFNDLPNTRRKEQGGAGPFYGELVESMARAEARWLLGLKRPRHLSRVRDALTSIVAVALLLIALREGIYLATSSLGRRAESGGGAAEALTWYARSQREWFSRDLRLSQTNLLIGDGNIEEAEESVRAYLHRNAEDARAWKLLGEVLVMGGAYPAAIDAYRRAFDLGGWNDLGISRGYLEALLAEHYRRPASGAEAGRNPPLHSPLADPASLIESRVFAFADAIQNNLHFTALSPNPGEAVKILIALSVLFPEKAEEYRTLIGRIETKAQEERGKIKARQPGWLW